MFRLVAFIDTKKLGAALEALEGVALSVETPQRVVNGVAPGKGVAKAVREAIEGDKADALAAHLRRACPDGQFDGKALKGALKALGMGAMSGTYHVNRLIKRGAVRRTKVRGQYSLTGAK